MTLSFKRRAFLWGAVSGAVCAVGAAVTSPRWIRNGSRRFFTDREARAVDAICAQLIPADQDPGAREAGVVNFMDIQLTRALKRYRKVYRQGLAALENKCGAAFGMGFADLSADRQVAMLSALEKESKPFFDLLLAHCRQGFYGDPRHGGNRDRVSWKMIGVPYPPVRGRMHYDQPKEG